VAAIGDGADLDRSADALMAAAKANDKVSDNITFALVRYA
jgi:serine/threonine protein phosphatase PrpC